MLDQEDLKWIAATTTELNSLLQQISRFSDLSRQSKGDTNYLDMLEARVDTASKTAQSLFDRVTSRILTAKAPENQPTARPTPAFKVVPKTPAASKPAAELPPDLNVKNPNGPRELILVVDDEMEVAELGAEMLADEGYKVVLAKDGFQALRIYHQIGPQIGLVILDFFLPVMDGDAVFDELRSINPNVDVVLSSGFAEQSKLAQMLARGLRGFIPKPYTREKLLAQVRSTLDAPQQGR